MVFINDYDITSSAGKNAASSLDGLLKADFTLASCAGTQGFKVVPSVENNIIITESCDLIQAEDKALQLLALVSDRLDRDALTRLPTERFGVIMASSRGATGLLENSFTRFSEGKSLSPKTSPQTTAGVFSAMIAQKFDLEGGAFTLSSACTSSLNSLGTAFHLIKSGLFDHVLAGGAEAPLTPFTLDMIASTGVSTVTDSPYPLRSFGQPSATHKKGMLLGEGAGIALLSRTQTVKSCAKILSFSMAAESTGLTGISKNADALVRAINIALQDAKLTPNQIDLISVHGSGTEKGDRSELNAYLKIFGDQMPDLLISKWATGHTLGSAGIISLALALEAHKNSILPIPPYALLGNSFSVRALNARSIKLASTKPMKILVTGLGFGGGASALIVETLS